MPVLVTNSFIAAWVRQHRNYMPLDSYTHFGWLADRFDMRSIPLFGIMSIGDILMVAGVIGLVSYVALLVRHYYTQKKVVKNRDDSR